MALLVVPARSCSFSARSTVISQFGGTALRRWQARKRTRSRSSCVRQSRNDSRMTCVLFLLIRARQRPAINQGNPSTFGLTRGCTPSQAYDVPHLWPRQARFICSLGTSSSMPTGSSRKDSLPPRRRTCGEPVYDFSMHLLVSTVFLRIGVPTGVAGAPWRCSWLFIYRVVIYLNLKVGPSFGAGILPTNAPHEARSGIISSTGRLSAGGSGRDLGRSICHTDSRHAWSAGDGAAVRTGVLNWRAVDRRTDEVETRGTAGRSRHARKDAAIGVFWHWETTTPIRYGISSRLRGRGRMLLSSRCHCSARSGTALSSHGVTSFSIRRP